MIPALREEFNRKFTAEKYQSFLESLSRACGTPIEFRVSETPCFVPKELLDRMAQYGIELVRQLLTNPKYLRISDKTVPPEYNVANQNPQPAFVSVDFGLVRNAKGGLDPKLVELQAFPTLYGYQPLSAQLYIERYDLPKHLGIYLGGFNHDTYRQGLRELIVGKHDPENVILMEIDPQHQKTLPDFQVTHKELGIAVVDVMSLKKRGDKLYYPKDGREIEVKRIYNRMIVDELEKKDIKLPFDITQPLDVEWAGHPNWYFRISKFSIPYLNHPCVPETWFLDENPTIPEDNENYILKPLYSFAGSGIKFAPTEADIDKIPAGERHNYIVQERLRFQPVIETPYGITQMETRIMYIWPEGGELTPVLPLMRMGRGIMMGVDYNRNLEWVGGTAGLWA
jgi:hypothetical protein